MVALSFALIAACAERTDEHEAPLPAADVSEPSAETEIAAAPAWAFDAGVIDAIVEGKDIVVFGEDSHGMPAVHEIEAQLFQYLVTEKGFRTFVFESAWGVEDAVDAFLASDRTEASSEEQFFLNAFNSPPTLALLLWAREYNRAHPDDPLRFTGYQPEQPVTDANALRDFAGGVDWLPAERVESALSVCTLEKDAFAGNIEYVGWAWKTRSEGTPTLTDAARATCVAGLEQLDASIRAGLVGVTETEERLAAERALLHVYSLRSFIEIMSMVGDAALNAAEAKEAVNQGDLAKLAYDDGDAARFEIFETLRRLEGDTGKVYMWMHNWHAFRHASETTMEGIGQPVSIGERLAEAYDDRLAVIGNLIPCGDCEEPEDSLEPAFAERFGSAVGTVDFDDAAGLPIHREGRLYANNHKFGFSGVVLARQMDGLIYLPDKDELP